jgi:hemerythrin
MFEWSNSYGVGITGIDAQDQNLFAMGRELHTAMSNGDGKASLAKILDRRTRNA